MATVRFLPRVAPLPLSSPRGPPPQAQEEPRPLHRQHLRWGRKHNVAPYFCVQKDFAPSSSNCRRCCPGRLLTCKKVGNAPYSSVPRSTWVTSPRHPCGREASEAAPRASLLSRRRQRLPRPGPARRAARGPDPGRAEGASGEPRLRSRAARPPPAPGPGALSRASGSRARGKAGPRPRVLRWRGGRGPQSLRRRGRPEPWGSREGSASLPSPPGRLGPTAACASSGWRFDWAGPGPPPEAGRIRQGPRPGAGGGRVQAAGRAGRPAGGRRVAAAPGLK